MSYAVATDLRARFGAREIDCLLDQDADGTPDEGRLEAALADAGAEIDARLAEAYELPLPAGPYPLLVGIACDLARARLYDDTENKTVMNGARRARTQLSELVDGSARLVTAQDTTIERRAEKVSIASPQGPIATALGASRDVGAGRRGSR